MAAIKDLPTCIQDYRNARQAQKNCSGDAELKIAIEEARSFAAEIMAVLEPHFEDIIVMLQATEKQKP